jgi:hypothetical protein
MLAMIYSNFLHAASKRAPEEASNSPTSQTCKAAEEAIAKATAKAADCQKFLLLHCFIADNALVQILRTGGTSENPSQARVRFETFICSAA